MEDIIGLEFLGSVTPIDYTTIVSAEDGMLIVVIPGPATEGEEDGRSSVAAPAAGAVDTVVHNDALTPSAKGEKVAGFTVEEARHVMWPDRSPMQGNALASPDNAKLDENRCPYCCTDLNELRNFPSNAEIIDDLEALHKERDDARESVMVMGERCAALREERDQYRGWFKSCRAAADKWEDRYTEAQVLIESYERVAAASAIVLQEQLNRITELTSANTELKIRYANDQAKLDRLEERYDSPIPVL